MHGKLEVKIAIYFSFKQCGGGTLGLRDTKQSGTM